MLTFPQFIANREFKLPADQMVHVVPVGEYPQTHPGTGKVIVQVVDDQACRAMLNNLQAEKNDPDFAGLCVDYEHFRHDPDKGSAAAGWIMNVEQRALGIFASPWWTGSGMAALKGGEYRFISPEFDTRSLEHIDGNRYRPTKLVGFGLTNAPNMRGMVPLSNRLTGPGGTADSDAQAAAHANLVRDLAASLRATNKTLPISESYRRAESALDAQANAALPLVIANWARELCAGDKHLPLSAAYHRAEAQYGNRVEVAARHAAPTAPSRPARHRPAEQAPVTAKDAVQAQVIANRARELCKADRKLSLAAAYQRAESEITGKAQVFLF